MNWNNYFSSKSNDPESMPVLDLPNYYMASSMTSSSLSVMIATQTKLIFLPKEIKTYVIKAKLAGRIIVSSFCELQTVHG